MTESATEELSPNAENTASSLASSATHHHLRGYLLALIAGVAWAGAGLISTWMNLDPLVVTGARTLASTVILGLGLLIFGHGGFKLPKRESTLPFLLIYGIFATAGMQLMYFEAIQANGAALGTLLKYLAPVFLLIIGALFYHRKITVLTAAGALVAIFGQALAVGFFSGGGLTLTGIGLFWGLLNALFFVIYTLMSEAGNAHYKSFTLLFYGMLIATVLWFIVLGPAKLIAPFLELKSLLQILLLAGVSTVLPFGCFLISMRYVDATRASIAAMLEPVAAGIGGFFFFGQPLTPSLLIGGVVSLGAIVIMRLADLKADGNTSKEPL